MVARAFRHSDIGNYYTAMRKASASADGSIVTAYISSRKAQFVPDITKDVNNWKK